MLTLTSPVKTVLHRVPASIKIVATLASTIMLFQTTNRLILLAVLVAIVAAYSAFGREFLRQGLAALRPVFPFFIVVSIWHLVTSDLAGGEVVILHLLTVLGIANLMTMTTPLTEMIRCVEKAASILAWTGIQPRSLALALALAIRFIPAFRQRLELIMAAWRARSCHRPKPRILIPILTSMFDDADHVADALRARGGVTSTPT